MPNKKKVNHDYNYYNCNNIFFFFFLYFTNQTKLNIQQIQQEIINNLHQVNTNGYNFVNL
jgi:hypothetical protein